MANLFESSRRDMDETEIIPDRFGFKSAGKKYINQNYKIIGAILGVEGEGLGVIKKQANRENKLPDIHGEIGLEQINFYRVHYDFSPLTQDEYESIKAQNISTEEIRDDQLREGRTEGGQPNIDSDGQELTPAEEPISTDTVPENPVEGEELQVEEGESVSVEPTTGESPEQAKDSEGEGVAEDELPGAEALQTELDRLIEVETQKEQTKESLSYNIDQEKLTRFKDNARQAISNFQQFVRAHSSPADKANSNVQEQYRQYENTAWNSLYNLAHLLDGEIATLPQDRDIQLSHPEGVDIRQYLETRGYRFDENGDITHINDNGFEIELNRAIKTDSLIKSRRPSHIVYDKSIYLDNDMNYQGYLVRGLNQQTPDFIVGVLDKNNLEPIIVDETGQSIPESDTSPATNPEAPEQAEVGETTSQVSLDDLRLAYARAEEAWNRKRGDEELEDTFIAAREAYNTELERVLKLQVAEGQEANIHQMFKDEFLALRDRRIEQSQELQGKWEKRLNPIKEKFVNFVIKHKKIISRLNLAAGVAGGALALTGVGIPLAGGLAVARRMVSATLLGVSTGEGIRSLGEDADINSFWGKIKFQAVIPKLVQESLASSEDEFKQVSGDVLKERLGTLEAYYRLNGGKFTSDNQQQAYEKVLTELARRVQENVIDAENPNLSIQPLTPEQLEKNKKLYGWGASYELAKIAKSQNIDLSLLSREEYADFAIQNKLRIYDEQLRMSLWQRMCESVDEVREGDKERQSLINLEADNAFDKFSLEMRQKAGEDNRNIDNNIIVRQGTNSSDHWLFFGINQGADSREDQIFKSYISLQDLNTLTPDKFTDFMKALRDSGYNGDIKVFQDLLSQGIRLNDQIVMHGASEADAKLGLDVADQFFGDSLADKSLGIDEKISGKKYSYSQILAQKIKNSIQESNSVEEQNPSTEFVESDRQKLETDRYTSELLNTISDTRITELDKFRRKRKIATGAGIAVGLLAGGAVHIFDEVNKPDSVELTDSSGSPTGGATPDTQAPGAGPGGAGAPETGGGVPKPNLETTTPPTGTGAATEEALRQARAAEAAAAAAEQAQELVQDVSSLDSGETIWGEIAKQLGENATDTQIQQAVENYLQSQAGQESIFELAQQTEGGRELLSQWGVDNAGEMSGLSKERLYEVSKYLGEGKLDGLTELSLDNLDALDPAVATTPSSAGAPTIEPGSTESPAPPAGPEVTGAEPLSPPAAEAPVTPQSTELPPVASTEFTRGVSEALGATNLTETQLQEVIYSFATSEQGSTELYNQIISNEEGARFLSGFGVNNAADFANIRPDRVYEIAQTVGVENLDKLLGFELNEIILSKFEDAPDMVELARGTRPLDVVNQYISSEIGNLPYDSTLGQQVLNTYLDTADGKQWLYDAIVNNPDVDNQNIQLFREYLRFKDIKSPEDFVSKFNWAEFSGNKNIPTSAFWNQTRLPNGVDKLQPLSTLLKPSRMLGIKDAVRQVLTRQ